MMKAIQRPSLPKNGDSRKYEMTNRMVDIAEEIVRGRMIVAPKRMPSAM